MNRRHAGIIALLLAGTAATGVAAVTKTASIGQAANGASDAEVAKRKAELDAWQQEIQAQLEQKPPKIAKQEPDATRASADSGRALVTYTGDVTSSTEAGWSDATPRDTSPSSSGHAGRTAPADEAKAKKPVGNEGEEAEPETSVADPAPQAPAAAVVVSAPGAQPTSQPVTHTSSSPTGEGESHEDDEDDEDEVEHEEEGGDD